MKQLIFALLFLLASTTFAQRPDGKEERPPIVISGKIIPNKPVSNNILKPMEGFGLKIILLISVITRSLEIILILKHYQNHLFLIQILLTQKTG